MAKKRRAGGGGGRRGGGGGAGSGDEEDRASEGSFESETSSMLSNGSTVRSEKASEDSHHPTDFMESLELLGEKRGSTREAGLKGMIGSMQTYLCADIIASNKETVTDALVGILRRPSTAEGVLGAQAVSLFMLILGPDEEEILGHFIAPMKFLITRCQHSSIRAECTKSLALSCFICSSEDDTTLGLLNFFEGVFAGRSEGLEPKDDLLAAAMDAWVLLATTAPSNYMTDKLRSRLLSIFLGHLDSSSADVKLAAGEALAYLNEYWCENDEDFEYPTEDAVVVEAIVARLQDLSREASRRISKRERKEQRSSFREVFASFAENQTPTDIISFRTKSFSLNSWTKIKQMNSLRDALASGFLNHLELNPVVHEIFDIPTDSFEDSQERNRVSKKSEQGKQRTGDMARDRRARENAKTHFLSCDEG